MGLKTTITLAAILVSYSDAQATMIRDNDDIRALVATGYFPTPGAQEYLIQTLIERRDKITEHWL